MFTDEPAQRLAVSLRDGSGAYLSRLPILHTDDRSLVGHAATGAGALALVLVGFDAAHVRLVYLDRPLEARVLVFPRLPQPMGQVPPGLPRSRWSFMLDTPFRLVVSRQAASGHVW